MGLHSPLQSFYKGPCFQALFFPDDNDDRFGFVASQNGSASEAPRKEDDIGRGYAVRQNSHQVETDGRGRLNGHSLTLNGGSNGHAAFANGNVAPTVDISKVDDSIEVEIRNGEGLPGPWRSWQDVQFPQTLATALIGSGFPAPSMIQRHAWPVASSGRDLIGVAKTGSGKTLGFLCPAFSELITRRGGRSGPFPSILVLAPTRELACQIEVEAQRFGSPAGIRTITLYGGAPRGPQLGGLRQRPHLVVATPGRLNDFLDQDVVKLDGVTFVVLDEADRMLDMGFEPQIRKIISAVPADRQTMMFTATWPAAVRRLASEFLRNPVEVRIGNVDELQANKDIKQQVAFCGNMPGEKERCLEKLIEEVKGEQTIVFTSTKRLCDSVSRYIMGTGVASLAIHGDKDQRERDTALAAFRSCSAKVLVATDVAARGLDIPGVRLVVNFDPANNAEDYVHRIGRTGRAGQAGTAVSILTDLDGRAAQHIAEVCKKTGCPVPDELEKRLASGQLSFNAPNQRSGRASSLPPRMRMGGDRDFGFGDMDFGGFGGGGFGGGGRSRMDNTTPCPTFT